MSALTNRGTIDRPIYGAPTKRVFGQTIGTLGIEGRKQAELLMRVLEQAMRNYAGRHEETFLAKMHRDLAEMERRSEREGWVGWEKDDAATLRALEARDGE